MLNKFERIENGEERNYKNHKSQRLIDDFMGMIEVVVPEGIPLKPLKKKIENLVKEEEARWVLFERAKEEINLSEAELEEFEEIRETVWREEKKKLGL